MILLDISAIEKKLVNGSTEETSNSVILQGLWQGTEIPKRCIKGSLQRNSKLVSAIFFLTQLWAQLFSAKDKTSTSLLWKKKNSCFGCSHIFASFSSKSPSREKSSLSTHLHLFKSSSLLQGRA